MIIECYVDGASRGHGLSQKIINHPDGSEEIQKVGEAAAAVVIYKKAKQICQFVRGLGKRTNNEAEAEAILLAVLICWSAGDQLGDPIIYSDSQTVVNQVNGIWRINSPNLKPIISAIQDLRETFRFKLVHQKRNEVKPADALCNLYLDQKDEL